jgi:hypothetical protein
LGSKDDAQWYPAEHLTTAPWEMVRKQLTFDILKNMIKSAAKKPDEN